MNISPNPKDGLGGSFDTDKSSITIACGDGQTISCNKDLLIRSSSILGRAVEADTSGSSSLTLSEGGEVVRALLQAAQEVGNGKCTMLHLTEPWMKPAMAESILQAANKYDIPSIRNYCDTVWALQVSLWNQLDEGSPDQQNAQCSNCQADRGHMEICPTCARTQQPDYRRSTSVYGLHHRAVSQSRRSKTIQQLVSMLSLGQVAALYGLVDTATALRGYVQPTLQAAVVQTLSGGKHGDGCEMAGLDFVGQAFMDLLGVQTADEQR